MTSFSLALNMAALVAVFVVDDTGAGMVPGLLRGRGWGLLFRWPSRSPLGGGFDMSVSSMDACRAAADRAGATGMAAGAVIVSRIRCEGLGIAKPMLVRFDGTILIFFLFFYFRLGKVKWSNQCGGVFIRVRRDSRPNETRSKRFPF